MYLIFLITIFYILIYYIIRYFIKHLCLSRWNDWHFKNTKYKNICKWTVTFIFFLEIELHASWCSKWSWNWIHFMTNRNNTNCQYFAKLLDKTRHTFFHVRWLNDFQWRITAAWAGTRNTSIWHLSAIKRGFLLFPFFFLTNYTGSAVHISDLLLI